MNYETKRNVFGQLLNAYQNLSMKDIQIPDENYLENITTPWNIVCDTALPDDIPVIPEAVGEYIKDSENLDLLVALTIASKGYKHPDLWIATHQNVFSSAWLDGVWCVQETGEIVKLEEEK